MTTIRMLNVAYLNKKPLNRRQIASTVRHIQILITQESKRHTQIKLLSSQLRNRRKYLLRSIPRSKLPTASYPHRRADDQLCPRIQRLINSSPTSRTNTWTYQTLRIVTILHQRRDLQVLQLVQLKKKLLTTNLLLQQPRN